MVLPRSKFRDDWSCWKITLGSLQRNVLSLDIVSTKHWNLGRWSPHVDMYLLWLIQIHSFFGYTLRSFVISTAFCGRNGQPFLDKNSTRWQSPFSAGVQGSHRLPMPRSDSTSSCSSCKRLDSIRIPPPPPEHSPGKMMIGSSDSFLLGPGIFSGATTVSFRECNDSNRWFKLMTRRWS